MFLIQNNSKLNQTHWCFYISFQDKCGANMTGDRGKLRASTEPMADCYYYIHKPGFRVFLTFTKFHFPSNVTNGTCDNSYVEILVGRDLVRVRVHLHLPFSYLSHGRLRFFFVEPQSRKWAQKLFLNYFYSSIRKDRNHQSNRTRKISTDVFAVYKQNANQVAFMAILFQSSKGRYCANMRVPDGLTSSSGLMVLRMHSDTDHSHTLPYFSAKYVSYSETAGRLHFHKGTIMSVTLIESENGRETHILYDTKRKRLRWEIATTPTWKDNFSQCEQTSILSSASATPAKPLS